MFYHLRLTFCLLLFLLITVKTVGQENPQPSTGFYMGAIVTYEVRTDTILHQTYAESGMNTIAQFAGEDTRSLINGYNVIACNPSETDWIHFYATGAYSKWEAEENIDTPYVGIKHKYGIDTTYRDTLCWSTAGLSSSADSIMYGPHYRQWKFYKRWSGDQPVNFIARYNMALQNDGQPPNTDVCKITVRVRHARIVNGNWDNTVPVDTLYPSVTLKVSDFNPEGHFKSIYFSPYPDSQTYNYNQYPQYYDESKMTPLPNADDTTYDDSNPENGVEFCLQWLGNNHLTLYIDNVEVYDNDGWGTYIETPNIVINRIQSYAQNYSSWSNLKYWYAHDEPSSRDAFIPMKTVDDILDNVNSAPIITHYYAGGLINGEDLLEKFVQVTHPKKLLVDIYPFSPDFYPVRWEDLEDMRDRFQEISSLDPNFYYTPQAFGYWYQDPVHPWESDWEVWRMPDTSEFKAPIMLALAHGAKGLIFSDYDTHQSGDVIDSTIVGRPDNFDPTELYYVIRDNLVPRLQGTLGDRLLGLEYSGNYISARYFIPSDNPAPQTYDYLTFPCTPFAHTANWQTGFFERNGYSDDKYFFVANLLPNADNSVCIELVPPISGFTNFRFRNYEGYFDTTFTGSSFTYTLTHSAGEGYLYEVAPVVEYGGKLYASETIGDNTTLYDDMTIENGATLTVNAIYDCYGNIYSKGNGKIVTTEGGTINFYNGKGIIIEGSPQIYGTSSYKLTLDFGSETEGIGIQVLQGADFKLEYCILKNAANLVFSDVSQTQTLISHCDFQNTSGYAVSLPGSSTRVPSINYCTFTNTDYGIFSAGQSSITISDNSFTDNKLAISLSQIPNVQILSNSISSDLESDPGILLSSCGGNIRHNSISGHTIALSLGNSSPVIGANTFFHNKINGIFVGPGSTPDLRAALVGNPPNWYPISGYNSIFENGGYCSGFCASNDDGSEIYFSNSNMLLINGCNYIADDRIVTPPLITRLKLMNGSTTVGRLFATYNAWGDTVYSARFGNLTVTYSPHYDTVCPLPIDQESLVIQDNDGNAIDTVYSSGEPPYTVGSLDLSYSEAAGDMISRDYSSADNIFNNIISSAPGDSSSQNAYLGLYKSKRLQNADSTVLAALRDLYNSNLPSISDSVMMKVVSQLSLLSI